MIPILRSLRKITVWIALASASVSLCRADDAPPPEVASVYKNGVNLAKAYVLKKKDAMGRGLKEKQAALAKAGDFDGAVKVKQELDNIKVDADFAKSDKDIREVKRKLSDALELLKVKYTRANNLGAAIACSQLKNDIVSGKFEEDILAGQDEGRPGESSETPSAGATANATQGPFTCLFGEDWRLFYGGKIAFNPDGGTSSGFAWEKKNEFIFLKIGPMKSKFKIAKAIPGRISYVDTIDNRYLYVIPEGAKTDIGDILTPCIGRTYVCENDRNIIWHVASKDKILEFCGGRLNVVWGGVIYDVVGKTSFVCGSNKGYACYLDFKGKNEIIQRSLGGKNEAKFKLLYPSKQIMDKIKAIKADLAE